jgi:hypothetical protein
MDDERRKLLNKKRKEQLKIIDKRRREALTKRTYFL